jgi:hypothetical protein
MVFTVRLDQGVKEQFLAAGLSKNAFATKMDLRDVDDFLKRIDKILKHPNEV